MQQKTGLIIVIAIGLLIILLALVLFFVQKPTPLPELGPTESRDAVEELTEGTTITDIEQDLEALKQETLFGDLEAEVQRVDEELESEGL